MNETVTELGTIAHEDINQQPFTIIPNEIFDNKDISPNGKLLMWYLLKHAGISGWKYSDKAMQQFLGCGRDKLILAFGSLRKAGYVTNVIIRTATGVAGSKRVFARTPIFLKENKAKTKKLESSFVENGSSETLKPRDPEFQGILKRKNIYKEKYIKNNNNKRPKIEPEIQTPRTPKSPREKVGSNDPVVVALFEKLELEDLAISRKLLTQWVSKHGSDYVAEKIALMESSDSLNPEGYLNQAIAHDWKPKLQKPSGAHKAKRPEPVYPTAQENANWWNNLSNPDKTKFAKFAMSKHLMFNNMVEEGHILPIAANFSSNAWFNVVMSLIGRGKQ